MPPGPNLEPPLHYLHMCPYVVMVICYCYVVARGGVQSTETLGRYIVVVLSLRVNYCTIARSACDSTALLSTGSMHV